ncbi:MAG: OmpH family outer membrane protein [Bacteroidales bacterium]|nr:OmpH family outer membrane protein [Bacteroidales bacterium]MCK4407028.1 OmpH family outer membrane protein [Bacteroidales bacterium]
MKNLLKIFIVLVFVAGYSTLNAQTNAKLGYINSNELFELMPGRDTIESQLKEYKTILENTIQTMLLEYQNKIQEYQVDVATMSDIIKQTKEKEITDLEARIQAFQQTADQDFSNKQAELFNPLLEKAKKAIKEVAEENGYTYIFDAGVGVLLYFEKGDNVLPLVKKNLGIE